MALEGLRARLEQLLADRTKSGDQRAYADGLYQAMLDTKVAIAEIRNAREVTGRQLADERQRLADAERRGRLADQIEDRETADLAAVWAGKHRERVALLERKLQVQEDELGLAQRQLDEMTEAYRQARHGIPPGGAPAASPPDPSSELDRAALELERQARQARVRDQLAELKRKLGKQD